MLQDRVAVITGGGQGIGAATAKRFAEEGAIVVCADIVQDAADRVVDEIKQSGGKAGAARVDVTDKEEVTALVNQVVSKYDRLDILINNAGITRDNLAIKMSEDEFDMVMKVNVRGTWIPSQAVIRPMRKLRRGRIVNTSSVASLGNAGQANYSSSKGAVISLTRTLALELAKSGITVNAVAPGAILTPMLEKVADDVRQQFVDRIPVNRLGTPEDVANAHLFLCSDLAGYITGQVVFVDGGMSVGM